MEYGENVIASGQAEHIAYLVGEILNAENCRQSAPVRRKSPVYRAFEPFENSNRILKKGRNTNIHAYLL
jgi:hypothetical protein